MSAGLPCLNRAEHFSSWVVVLRKANRSAFNGYRLTSSAYSEVRCLVCNAGIEPAAAG